MRPRASNTEGILKGYADFFEAVTGMEPYPYQNRMGSEEWPDVLHVPTGMGKTAAIIAAWLWRRLDNPTTTPRRLAYCLPMRVLVEQTADSAAKWVAGARPFFDERGLDTPSVHILMGGHSADEWRRHPGKPALLVGTQDMLLSRALMRGYGMSRYGWPIDYALLHNDCLWVYDEVQLMGPAVATSAQLEAFRRRWRTAKPSRSLWASATLRPDWLDTVDFPGTSADLVIRGIGDEDLLVARDRLKARKRLKRSPIRLENLNAGSIAAYARDLAAEVVACHQPGSQTIVVLNRVERAQALYRALKKLKPAAHLLLLHARFRSAERSEIEKRLREPGPPPAGRIVISTQAIEAGIDITSRTLVTELSPWSSMVQRFGRCNRYGEATEGASVIWIDMALLDGDAAPYTQAELDSAREVLEGGLVDVGPHSLPDIQQRRPFGQVLRERDFLELFNIDPDLQGFDIDVAPFIRDQGTPQVQVFWRRVAGTQPDQPQPKRAELCPVSMGQLGAYFKKKLKGKARRAWRWDPLAPRTGRGKGRWAPVSPNDRVVPGSVLMIHSEDGGYDPGLGFEPALTGPVTVHETDDNVKEEPYGGDPDSYSSVWLSLRRHLQDVRDAMEEIVIELDVSDPGGAALLKAAAWHDVGKAHAAFQTAIGGGAPQMSELWAKSPGKGVPNYGVPNDDGTIQSRPYFRHELASMLAWLAHNAADPNRDLIAYLIASHHGKVRTGLRALPGEQQPSNGSPFARGIWDGDALPALQVDRKMLPQTILSLDLMRMGLGLMGPSWTERTGLLLRDLGPFMLSWLETLLRIADWKGSGAGEAVR